MVSPGFSLTMRILIEVLHFLSRWNHIHSGSMMTANPLMLLPLEVESNVLYFSLGLPSGVS